MRKTGVVCAALVMFGLLAVPSSWGATEGEEAPSRKRPPRALLTSAETTQRGNLGTYCWHYTDGKWGVGTCVDTSGYGWPRATRAGAGDKAKIVFDWEQAPTDLSLHGWSRIRKNGSPIGRGRDIAYRWRPERTPGEGITGWAAHIRLPDRTGHLYLSSSVEWDDESNGGDAFYAFHLLLR
ncbi:MAG: hypothetical protein M3391_00410 [Actinomycetota bacterium]|nr:hypothetical protein [Actinomycetota bacterium]